MPFCAPVLVFFTLHTSMELTRWCGQTAPVPVAPHPHLAAADSVGPNLDAHLAAWERTLAAVRSIRFDFTFTRRDPAAVLFPGESSYTGSLVAMRPNYLRIRLANSADSKDFEAFIGNGKSVYAYHGLQKTITELVPGNCLYKGLSGHILLELLRLMPAKELRSRFEVQLFKEDANYLYLHLKPLLEKDRMDFTQLRVALVQTRLGAFAYLPAQVYLVRPTGETEHWKFSNHKTNLPEISEKLFQLEEVPGFRLQNAPATIPKSPPSDPPSVAVSAGTGGWAESVMPCDQVGRGLFRRRSGLFRNRIAGYKCATAGHVPVIGWVYGVQSCEPPVSRSWPLRWASHWAKPAGGLSSRSSPRRGLCLHRCRRPWPRPIRNSMRTWPAGKSGCAI